MGFYFKTARNRLSGLPVASSRGVEGTERTLGDAGSSG